jgi:hypothetical protein
MEIGSTSISELPVQQNTPPLSGDEQVENINIKTDSAIMDSQVVNTHINTPPQEKKVRFEDQVNNETKRQSKYSNFFVLKLEHKIVILATFFFFVFFDKKFQKYILNILVQVFGTFLKTEHGNMTKIGTFFYSIFFGITCLAVVTFVDLSSFHLAF